jgi:hypothetical protein
MFSTVLIYFENTESKIAGSVFYISNIKAGSPFFIEDFRSCWNVELFSFVISFLSFTNLFNSHFVAWFCGSIRSGHLLPSIA